MELRHHHVIHYVLVLFNIFLNILLSSKVPHMFAFVYWYKVHPRATWFHPRIIVASPDMVMNGPAVFLPISRLFAPCAVI